MNPAWMTTLLKVYREMASVGGLVALVLAGILIYQKIHRAREGPGTTTRNVVVSTQTPVPAPLPPVPAPLPPPPPSLALVPIPPHCPVVYSDGVELAPLLPHGGGLQAQQLTYLQGASILPGGCRGEMPRQGATSQGQEVAVLRYYRPDAALL